MEERASLLVLVEPRGSARTYGVTVSREALGEQIPMLILISIVRLINGRFFDKLFAIGSVL